MQTYARATLAAVVLALFGLAQSGLDAQTKRLMFEVRQVKAVDECGNGRPEEIFGSDEISFGGVSIDPAGNVHKLRTMNAGSFKRDGSQRTFNPAKQLVIFNVRGNKYPQTYQALLVLVERDPGGGFGKYLDRLVKEARELTDSSADPNVPMLLPARYTPGAALQIPEILSTIAAEKIGKAVLGAAKKEINQRWADDIFDPVLQTVTLRDAQFEPPKTMTTLAYKKHNCSYRVIGRWHLD